MAGRSNDPGKVSRDKLRAWFGDGIWRSLDAVSVGLAAAMKS